jgi:hypothetical protein
MAHEIYRLVLSGPWKSLSNSHVEQDRSALTLLDRNHLDIHDTATRQLDERHHVCRAEERLEEERRTPASTSLFSSRYC